ncbi:MAG: hypothetical protein FWC15_05895, partial [Fibromonadales bacterium]|nr:hypothetical protein [Fibromonadales bacterium]
GEKSWEVEIFLPGVPDTARFRSFGYYVYPPDWDKFLKLMESMKKRASQDLENKLKVEYEKRFKKPITEQELTTEVVDFDLDLKNKTSVHKSSFIAITRTASGATVHYRTGPKEGVKISTEDWLDFINALYNSSFMNWDKSFGDARPAGQKDDVYRLNIYNSNNAELLKFNGFNKYPPNWDKFIKVINDVRAKAKKDNVAKEMESKMKTEYQKKFKKPISEFELSIKSMLYHGFSRAIDQSVDIHLNRTATGAVIEYKVGRRDDNTKLKAELSMGEWLDFLNSLQQCPENSYYEGKWKRNDMCCRKNAQDYKFLDIPYMWRLEISSSGDTDEMEFYARDICLPKWNEFVKTLDVKRK